MTELEKMNYADELLDVFIHNGELPSDCPSSVDLSRVVGEYDGSIEAQNGIWVEIVAAIEAARGGDPMTRREFDAATKRNWGGPFMASDERATYREGRFLPDLLERDPDHLARRAAYSRHFGIPALSRGSRFCASALYAARKVTR